MSDRRTSLWRSALGERLGGRIGALITTHPIACVFVVALVIRTIAAIIAAVLPEDFVAVDDSTYQHLARDMAAGETGDWTEREHRLYGQTATLLVPITFLYRVFGPVEWMGIGVVVLCGAGTAALVTVLALMRVEHRWAVIGGLAIAVMPSQVVWSTAVLKDPAVWVVSVALAVCVAHMFEGAPPRRWFMFAGASGLLLFLLAHLRLQSTFVAAWGIAVAALVIARRDVAKILVVLAIAVVVPWVGGGGPAGINPVVERFGAFDEQRAAGAEEAGSAIAVASNDLFHLPRGLSVMLLEPAPWAENRNSRIVLAKLDLFVWYPVLVAGLFGLKRVRDNPTVLLFPTLLFVGMLLGYALSEGNLGTAFRHRGELVWPMVLLGSFALSGPVRSQSERA